jgi:hypothetical protein
MGAAFWTGGTVRIRNHLRTFFGKNRIRGTANSFLALFDPANGRTISQALVSMDLPPRGDPDYGARLQQRFVLLFDNMMAADSSDGTTTHDTIKRAVFDVLTKAKNTPPRAPVEPIKFYVSHQVAAPPYSPANPRFRFVQWEENDDNGQAWFNFLLICPELPGPIAARLKKVVTRKYGSASKAKKKTKKKKAKAKKY